MNRLFLPMIAVASLACGCVSEPLPVRRPAPPSQVETLAGWSARYDLPSGAVIDVTLVGPRAIRPDRPGHPGYQSLQFQIEINNYSLEPIVIGPREQIAHLGSWGVSLPADVSDHAITVGPGERRSIDLFYPAPVPSYGIEQPFYATLDWRVHLRASIVAARARFDRVRPSQAYIPRASL
jgi:hypothetical protein